MSTEDTEPLLPKGYLRAALLLLVREEPAHGYELLDRLGPLGADCGDPGRLYRTLRALEQEGRVRSAWTPSTSGPQRRIYRITRLGMQELHATTRALLSARDHVDVFISRYQEFVALDVSAARETQHAGGRQ